MRSDLFAIGARRLVRPGIAALLALCLAMGMVLSAAAQELPMRTMYKSTHQRVGFDRDISRVAVGDAAILSTETLTDRELLFLGKEVGRTSVIIWFQDGEIEEFTMLVHRDLSMLERLLKDIHEGIVTEVAPDRDAVVLRGLVPDVSYSVAAENAARSYLEADAARRGSTPLVQGGEDAGVEGATVRVQEDDRRKASKAVINLIQLERLPDTIEAKLSDSFESIGATDVTISRIMRGYLPDDAEDLFILDGTVPNQIALTRVLAMASNIVSDKGQGSASDIEVIADEAGALVGQATQSASVQTPSNSSTSVGGGSSGLTGANLLNQVEANIGRAKVLELADGRVLSYIEVEDLPLVRVDIRFYEVDRTKLFNFTPATIAAGSDFKQGSLNPPLDIRRIEGEEAVRTGSQSEVDVQGVVAAIAGGFGTQFQVAGKNFAIDTAFDLLESKGIARVLTRPSLSVLSGEVAVFSVGGEVPISTQIYTDVTGGDGSESVLNETQFRSFGVELGVRPLVSDDNMITMDLVPSISLPDATLTASVRESSGSDLDTTAFETRFLRTSTRLKDGQALILGGLNTIRSSENTDSTPWLSNIPLLGWMFKTRQTQDQHMELIVVVHPVVVREPIPEAALWAYPEVRDLLGMARAGE